MTGGSRKLLRNKRQAWDGKRGFLVQEKAGEEGKTEPWWVSWTIVQGFESF